MKKAAPITADQIQYPVPTFWPCKDWTICTTKREMLNTADLEIFAGVVKVHRMPDIFYGYNSVYIANPKYDFVYKVTAVEALQFCAFGVREKHPLLCASKELTVEDLKTQVEAQNKKAAEAKEIYNPINALPVTVLAKQSEVWAKKDFTTIKDFQKIEAVSDWTYTTPYKGSLAYLSKAPVPHFLPSIVPIKSLVTVEPTNEAIPFHKLGKDNPVLQFDEIPLFEDDLDDLGFAQMVARCRVMKDSFYMLLRNYVRVDGMFVRIMDTRVYHELGTNYILREFQYKESTYDELRKKGFEFTSEWVLSHSQADIIFPQLDIKIKFMDKIMF